MNHVDAIIVIITIKVTTQVNADTKIPTKIVGNYLAETSPAIIILIWRAKPTAFAVF